MLSFEEMMFYAESEGLLPTRTGKINAAIRDIQNDPRSTISQEEIEKYFSLNGIDPNSLSYKEICYINSKIN